jgi:hypothetical protein
VSSKSTEHRKTGTEPEEAEEEPMATVRAQDEQQRTTTMAQENSGTLFFFFLILDLQRQSDECKPQKHIRTILSFFLFFFSFFSFTQQNEQRRTKKLTEAKPLGGELSLKVESLPKLKNLSQADRMKTEPSLKVDQTEPPIGIKTDPNCGVSREIEGGGGTSQQL